jgi:hypothetical protein
MSKKLTQCELVRGDCTEVSWIPTKYAVEGGLYDGWLVKSVYQTTNEEIGTIEQAVRQHRKRTGDDTKKVKDDVDKTQKNS